MSSHIPIMGTALTRLDDAAPVIKPQYQVTQLLAESAVFELRRSSLVTWTVRAARVADHLMARAFSGGSVRTKRKEQFVERTLNGLDRCCRRIPAHHGVVAAERTRLQLENVLKARRERYRRFQQLRQAMRFDLDQIDQPGLCLHLNPVNKWIRMSNNADSATDQTLAGSVLFFLAGNEVRGLRMTLEGQVLINELADYQPIAIARWAELSSLADVHQLEAVGRQLADIGLVAWGEE